MGPIEKTLFTAALIAVTLLAIWAILTVTFKAGRIAGKVLTAAGTEREPWMDDPNVTELEFNRQFADLLARQDRDRRTARSRFRGYRNKPVFRVRA